MDADQDGEGLWLDHVYRLFYYDATPYDGVSHHPILNRRIEFGRSDVASFRRELFSELRVEFLLDPMWQQVSEELNEHVDGVVSVFPRPVAAAQALIAA